MRHVDSGTRNFSAEKLLVLAPVALAMFLHHMSHRCFKKTCYNYFVLTTSKIIIGIDEAGRGPLAGPIAVGAFAVKASDILKYFRGVKESKQLTEKQRDEWFRKIIEFTKRGEVAYAVSFSMSESIDSNGLTEVVRMSIDRCMKRLEKKGFAGLDSKIKLDGLLYAPHRYRYQETIIDGDSKESIIALASICAKVLRDRHMKKLALKYPQYGFDVHKGYGTKKHYEAIKKYGILSIHRVSFLKR